MFFLVVIWDRNNILHDIMLYLQFIKHFYLD